MPRKEKKKAITWERDRRSRMNNYFKSLEDLLPECQEGRKRNKVEILAHASRYIKDLQSRTINALEKEELAQLKRLVIQLLSRTQVLTSLLKDAGITVPEEPALEKITPLKWSNKINVVDDTSFPSVKKKKKEKIMKEDSKNNDSNKKDTLIKQSVKDSTENQENLLSSSSIKKNKEKEEVNNVAKSEEESPATAKKVLQKNPTSKSLSSTATIKGIQPATLVFPGGGIMPVVSPIGPNIIVNTQACASNPIILNGSNVQPMILLQNPMLSLAKKVTLPRLNPRDWAKNVTKIVNSSKIGGHKGILPKIKAVTETTMSYKVPIPAIHKEKSEAKPSLNNKVSKTPSKAGEVKNNSSKSSNKLKRNATEPEKSDSKKKKAKIDPKPDEVVVEDASKKSQENNEKTENSEKAMKESKDESKKSVGGSCGVLDNLLQDNVTEDQMSREINKVLLNLDTNTTTTMKLNTEPPKTSKNKEEHEKDTNKNSRTSEKVVPYSSSNSFIPIGSRSDSLHSDLSNDIFASLQVPSSANNSESISPTAAFLMAFPLVTSLNGKVDGIDDELKDEFKYSSQTPPMLLQIGAIEPISFKKQQSASSQLPAPPQISTSQQTLPQQPPSQHPSYSQQESPLQQRHPQQPSPSQQVPSSPRVLPPQQPQPSTLQQIPPSSQVPPPQQRPPHQTLSQSSPSQQVPAPQQRPPQQTLPQPPPLQQVPPSPQVPPPQQPPLQPTLPQPLPSQRIPPSPQVPQPQQLPPQQTLPQPSPSQRIPQPPQQPPSQQTLPQTSPLQRVPPSPQVQRRLSQPPQPQLSSSQVPPPQQSPLQQTLPQQPPPQQPPPQQTQLSPPQLQSHKQDQLKLPRMISDVKLISAPESKAKAKESISEKKVNQYQYDYQNSYNYPSNQICQNPATNAYNYQNNYQNYAQATSKSGNPPCKKVNEYECSNKSSSGKKMLNDKILTAKTFPSYPNNPNPTPTTWSAFPDSYQQCTNYFPNPLQDSPNKIKTEQVKRSVPNFQENKAVKKSASQQNYNKKLDYPQNAYVNNQHQQSQPQQQQQKLSQPAYQSNYSNFDYYDNSFTYRSSTASKDPNRAPVNWMMTPEIKHNSDIILPTISKELDFFSSTSTSNYNNQFYNSNNCDSNYQEQQQQAFSWSPTKITQEKHQQQQNYIYQKSAEQVIKQVGDQQKTDQNIPFLSVSQLVSEQEKANEKSSNTQQSRKQRKHGKKQVKQQQQQSCSNDQEASNYSQQQWRARNCKSNYTAEALIGPNLEEKNSKYPGYPVDPMSSINYFTNNGEDANGVTNSGGGYTQSNFNPTYPYSSNPNVYSTANFTPTSYMPLHESNDYLDAGNFLLSTTEGVKNQSHHHHLHENAQHQQTQQQQQNCDPKKSSYFGQQKKNGSTSTGNGKRKHENNSIQQNNYPDFSIPAMDDYHNAPTTSFLTPPNSIYPNHSQSSVYSKTISSLPLPLSSTLSTPSTLVSSSANAGATQTVTTSNTMAMPHQASGTSLTNFNLSTIFPEMNDKVTGYKSSTNRNNSVISQSTSQSSVVYSQQSNYPDAVSQMSQVSNSSTHFHGLSSR